MNGSETYKIIYTGLATRYLMVAGIAFLAFYILFPKKFIHKKLQSPFPERKDYLREFGFSMCTLFIFAFIGTTLKDPHIRPHTRIYSHISEMGTFYFVFSIFLALVIHDTYFYWMHRMIHHPKLFKIFHLVHHRSVNPSPWAAYAFHPLEAVLEGAVIYLIAFLIPVHYLAIASFMIIMIFYNVYGHLGYEIYPRWILKSPVGRWLNTSTNHNMHHKFFKGNYGLYFRFWDEALKTTHPDYERNIENLFRQRVSQNQ